MKIVSSLIPLFTFIIMFTETSAQQNGHYATVNGLSMYYEIHGKGKPLVLIHGGGSTIETTFGRILPILAKHYQIIAVELQAHGRTADRDAPETFEQDADDVAALIGQLRLEKVNILGFSNGGNTALRIAIRHPQIVDKLIAASAFYKRDGLYPQFWEFMPKATLQNMPQALKDAYLRVNNNPKGLETMHNKDRDRMLNFKDWVASDIQAIQAPTLLIMGDADVIKPEHTVEMYRLLPNGKLVILPGLHGEYLGEIAVAKPGSKMPKLTAGIISQFIDE
jgi:pimeloyl-ACP methyl ester carboxylesterase